jgi:hypothetical protein
VCEAPGEALCPGCRGALVRLAPPLCERCGSPGAWPVRRCAECARRRSASRRRGRRSSTTSALGTSSWAGRSAVGEGSRSWRRSSSPRRSSVRPPTRSRSSPPIRSGGTVARRRARRAAGARARPALGAARAAAARTTRAGPRQRGQRLADRRRNVRGVFAPPSGRRRGSCSSTTSTRAAPRRRRARPRSVGPARAGWTSSLSARAVR